jgi:tetratricopeptide (TPR) repeat protein
MIRICLSISLLAASSVLLIGCGGPTKAGIEARSEARDRMGLVNAQLSYDQAKRAFEVGQFDRALRDISHAIDRFPYAPAYHLLHGRILLETHRLERALGAFERAVETAEENDRGPGDPERLAKAHYFAGIVFQRWSNHDDAHRRYLTAADLDESNAQYLMAAAESMIALGKYDAAHDLIEPRLAFFEHNAAMRHLLGHVALLRGDAHYASQLFARARLLNPDDPMLAEELAWSQYAAGKYAHCVETLQQLKRLSPAGSHEQRLDLLHLEARCLMHLERNRDARTMYMELTRLSPADPDVWIELGALAWELGDHRRVAESAARAIALAPDRYEGYALRGIHAREQGRLEDAESAFRQATRRAPDSALPQLLLAQVLEQREQHKEALKLYGQVIRMFPNNREALMLFSQLSDSPALNQMTAVSGE